MSRDSRGRFTHGNGYGIESRFRPGRTGNPRGRPAKVRTYMQRLRDAHLDEHGLRAIATDRRQSENARHAARLLLIPLIVDQRIPIADPRLARVLYYRLCPKDRHELVAILLDERQRPERREGARRRLMPWPSTALY